MHKSRYSIKKEDHTITKEHGLCMPYDDGKSNRSSSNSNSNNINRITATEQQKNGSNSKNSCNRTTATEQQNNSNNSNSNRKTAATTVP